MRKGISLTKRNCKVFLRDRGAVFFSILSMLIVLLLMTVFLGGMNVDEVTALLKQYGGARDAALDREHAVHLVQYWTLAGILVVNAVTVTLTVVGVMVTDASENRLQSFYAAPVGRNRVALSYIAAAILIGTLFCLLTLAVGTIYICATGGEMLSWECLGKIAVYIVLNVSIFAVLMFLTALFVKSSGAWSGIATIVGTLVGFVGAIYLPMGALPEGVTGVLKALPVLHGASLMRSEACRQALADTFYQMPPALAEGYKLQMGIAVGMGQKSADTAFQVIFIVLWGVAAMAAAAFILHRKSEGNEA